MQRRGLAFRLLFRLASASFGLICLGFSLLFLAFNDPVGGTAFALAAVSYFLAGTVLRLRALTIVGFVLLTAALVHNTATQGTSWTNTVPLGFAGLSITVMSVFLDVRTLPDGDSGLSSAGTE